MPAAKLKPVISTSASVQMEYPAVASIDGQEGATGAGAAEAGHIVGGKRRAAQKVGDRGRAQSRERSEGLDRRWDGVDIGTPAPQGILRGGVVKRVSSTAACQHIHPPATAQAIGEGGAEEGVVTAAAIQEEVAAEEGDGGEIKGIGGPVAEEPDFRGAGCGGEALDADVDWSCAIGHEGVCIGGGACIGVGVVAGEGVGHATDPIGSHAGHLVGVRTLATIKEIAIE